MKIVRVDSNVETISAENLLVKKERHAAFSGAVSLDSGVSIVFAKKSAGLENPAILTLSAAMTSNAIITSALKHPSDRETAHSNEANEDRACGDCKFKMCFELPKRQEFQRHVLT